MVFCPFDGEVLEEKEIDPLIGRKVDGKYLIESKIGEGGMGAVYRAKHIMMDHAVAIKVLHATLVADKTAVARFQREAQAAARIKHPNAVTVTDFGVTEDNIIYIVMELFLGQSLREMLEKQRRLDWEQAVEITRQACAALDAAHRSGVIHRDVKPDNIVIEHRPGQGDVVKVLDFGIAKLKDEAQNTAGNLTRQGVIIGSPHYLSPEQCQSANLDARSDVYSFGVVLYEMLTGEVPFTANTPVAVALKHANEIPRSMRVDHPEIPEVLDKVVLRALSKEPDRRQQGAVVLAEEFEQAVRVALTQTSSGSTGPQTPAPSKRIDIVPERGTSTTGSNIPVSERRNEVPLPVPPRSSGANQAVTNRRPEVTRPPAPPPPKITTPTSSSGPKKPAPLNPTPKRVDEGTGSGGRSSTPSSSVVYHSSVLDNYGGDDGDKQRRTMIFVFIGIAVVLLIGIILMVVFS
ncbi:MAG: protein kinase [Blastocatellia bacterium]|nr:protein kinase [Blastocatellia bacterium]